MVAAAATAVAGIAGAGAQIYGSSKAAGAQKDAAGAASAQSLFGAQLGSKILNDARSRGNQAMQQYTGEANDFLQGYGQKAAGGLQQALPGMLGYYDTAYGQGANALSPYLAVGRGAAQTLGNWYGDPGAAQSALEATPGYQFTLSQGLKATQNSAAARGLGSSGAALKGAANYATGLADSTYQNQFNNLLSMLVSGQGAADSLSQLGYNTAAGKSGAQGQITSSISNIFNSVGQTGASNLANLGQGISGNWLNSAIGQTNALQGASTNAASNTIGAGDASAAAYNTAGQSIAGGANALAQYLQLRQFAPGMYSSGGAATGGLY